MATLSATRIRDYFGLAKDSWALRRAPTEEAQKQARKHLIERMGRLRSLPQKLGQILSFADGTSDDDDYSVLCEDAAPLPLKAVQSVLEAEWGKPLHRIVRDISAEARGASLGQVHRAVLRDGREVAVKVQYPGIREAVHLDLKMLGWLSVPVGNLRRGFDLPGYRDAILSDLERELDYRQEAQIQREFFDWSGQGTFLIVPQVIDELCTSRVLVASWEEGDTWRDVPSAWSAREKEWLGAGLVEFFHEGLFRRGIMHADWHPGNLRFRRDGGTPRLVLYDFGCVYRPADDVRFALLRLIRATCRQDESPYPLLLRLGFRDDYLHVMRSKLPALCKVLFEPYSAEYPYDLADWRLGERIGDILGDDRWNFRIAGPAELVFLLRAFHGLRFYVERLGARTSWNRVIAPLFETYSRNLDLLLLPRPDGASEGFEGLARELKIRVSEAGQTRVQITQAVSAVDFLDELIDPDLANRIRSRGINLATVVSDVRRRCYAPGVVFRHAEDSREILVWLE